MNKTEFGTHVSNSAADKAALRRDYKTSINGASADELKEFNKRDVLMRKVGIPAISNHKAYIKRYGKEIAYFAWKTFREVKTNLIYGRIDQDENFQMLSTLDDILMDRRLTVEQMIDVIMEKTFEWHTYNLEDGTILDTSETRLYNTRYFRGKYGVQYLFTVRNFSDEARIRDLFAVSPKEKEAELYRRAREKTEKKYMLLLKNEVSYMDCFNFREDGWVNYPAIGYCYATHSYDIPGNCWQTLREADKAYIVLQVPKKPKREQPKIFWAGLDYEQAKAEYESLIESECRSLLEKRRSKSGDVSSTTRITGAQAAENLRKVKMGGYQMPHHDRTDLVSIYGLKAIQFGNATSTRKDKLTDEQKEYLDRLDEFLTVSSDILGILPEDMGQVVRSYAWSARGRKNAKAHYEGRGHLDNIVNASRRTGHDGTHAHEFGHGLDYFLGWCYLSKDKTSIAEYASNKWCEDENIPKACKNLVEFINSSYPDYTLDSIKADKREKKTYFNKPTEKFARAYACFLEDELKEREISAPFAVCGEQCPPTGEERKKLRVMFRKVIDELIEAGHVRSAEHIEEDISVAATIEAPAVDFTVENDGQLRMF